MYTVYMHTTPSNKVYIGITEQKPEQRWRNGNGYKNNEHFYRAILKYGWDNIKHEIICQAPMSAAQAGAIEKSFIHLYDSTNPDKGYNHSIGGEGGALGVHQSAETRKKISEAHKGRPSPRKGAHLSAETRKKISESQKGRTPAMKGKHLSQETRKKLSELRKGANNPHYGKHPSAETLRKMSEASKRSYLNNPERLLKYSEANKKAVICVETGILYSSVTEAAKSIGVTRTAISFVVRGINKTAGGYHWKYAERQ